MYASIGKNALPPGLKDLMPEDADVRGQLVNKIQKVFHGWGYREIILPTYEYFDTFRRGISGNMQKEMCKFIDREGNILTLRPEITTSIARMAGSTLNENTLPKRFSYTGNVFRYDEPHAGKQKEFYQAGVELLGRADDLADAEVIAVAIDCLKAVGMQGFTVAVGSAEFFTSLVRATGLSEEEQDLLKRDLAARNLVSYREKLCLIEAESKEKEVLDMLHTLQGGEDIIDQALKMLPSEECCNALEHLRSVYRHICSLGFADQVSIDLGIVRDLDYYTGIVFEGFVAEAGFPLAGGGRYDNLLGEFGAAIPATGFALNTEQIILALDKQGKLPKPAGIDRMIIYPASMAGNAFKLAESLRQEGVSVILAGDMDEKSADNYARIENVETILLLEESGCREIACRENR